jgi:hypothetical protein
MERQREQLERIQRKLDETEVHADHSTSILRGMKSIFGTIVSKLSGKSDLPADVLARRTAERAVTKDVKDADLAAKRSVRDAVGGPELYKSKDPAFKEEDELLQQISNNVSGIKRVGEAMKDELDRHDTLIEEVGTSADRVNGKIRAADKTARKIGR